MQKPTPTSGKGIMAFTVKTMKCMGCKAPIKGDDNTLCDYCKPREGELYIKNLGKVRGFSLRFKLKVPCTAMSREAHLARAC